MSNVKLNISAKISIFWKEDWEGKGYANTFQQLTMHYKLK